MTKPFKLRYLPLFEQDVAAARDYIARVLQNPAAAMRLVEDVERAILKRLENPLSFQPFPSARPRKQPYFRINIRRYAVFYVVSGNTMEVRRFLYGRRNIPQVL